MQTLHTYIISSVDDNEDTRYELPRSVLALAGMESPLTAVFTGIYGVNSIGTLQPYLNKHLQLENGQGICPCYAALGFSNGRSHTENGSLDAFIAHTDWSQWTKGLFSLTD